MGIGQDTTKQTSLTQNQPKQKRPIHQAKGAEVEKCHGVILVVTEDTRKQELPYTAKALRTLRTQPLLELRTHALAQARLQLARGCTTSAAAARPHPAPDQSPQPVALQPTRLLSPAGIIC